MDIKSILTETDKNRYEDSLEFTEELEKIDEVISSRRFHDWLDLTDETHSTHCVEAGKELDAALDRLWAELQKADD